MSGTKSRLAVLALLVLVGAGCHSACFQTAKIHSGINTTFGLTMVDAGSRYLSVFSLTMSVVWSMSWSDMSSMAALLA